MASGGGYIWGGYMLPLPPRGYDKQGRYIKPRNYGRHQRGTDSPYAPSSDWGAGTVLHDAPADSPEQRKTEA